MVTVYANDARPAQANGLLAMTEMRAGMGKLFGQDAASAIDGIIEASFDEARTAKASRAERGAEFVEKTEFRLFLIYVKRRFLHAMLDVAEREGDGRLDQKQFAALVRALSSGWDVNVGDPAAEFKRLDELGATVIPFPEFRKWALAKGVAADDITVHDAPPASELELKVQAAVQTGRLATTALDLTAGLDLPQLISRLPCSVLRTDAHARAELFDIL